MASRTRRFAWGGLLAVFYAGLVLVRFHPLLPDFQTHHLGAPQPDLLNEAWLHQAVLRGIPRGAVLWTDALEFPYGVHLLSTYLSYAHLLFTAPLALLLPWPTWWNASFLVALVSSALAAAWAVRRISGSTVAGVLAGVPFVVMPWVVNEAWLGHLSQLWMAPMFCAAGCLHQVFHVPEDRHAWRNLALWTVLAALTYWIYGLLLALLGVLVLACHVPRLSRPLAGRLLAAVLVTVGLLGPLADFQFSRELVLREAAAGGITASTREAALKRAMGASVCLGPLGHGPDGRPLVRATPLGSWLPGGFLALGLALVLLEWRDRSGLSAWLLAALFFAALGLGPYLQQGGALLGDRAGNPVLMPFQYLVEGIPPLTRWSLPSRAVPMAMFCLCAALAVGLRRLDGRSRPVRAVAALLACALAGAAASWMTYHPEPQRSFTPARIPEFCRFLERQPRGAVVDLPLGFAGNAWQLQMLHHQPAVQGAQPLPRLVVENAWLREVHGWNWKLVPGATPELAAAALRSASYLPYGTPRALRLAGFYGSADAPRGREGASSLPVLRHALAQLRRLGVRYLVLHRANCGWIAPAPGEDAWRAFRKAAGQHFGGLLYEDAEAAVFALPPTVRLEGPPDAGGGEKDQGRGNPRP